MLLTAVGVNLVVPGVVDLPVVSLLVVEEDAGDVKEALFCSHVQARGAFD